MFLYVVGSEIWEAHTSVLTSGEIPAGFSASENPSLWLLAVTWKAK